MSTNTKTLSQQALEVIGGYAGLKIGNAVAPVPYFNNKTVRARMTVRALIGKGRPEDIRDEANAYIIKHHVSVDTLTGEWKLLRADNLYDAGKSLNPALDIGQVEGAFIQGMGWLTMEELVWHPADGSAKAGLLTTHAPSTYKIPTANDCPAVFNTRLYERPNVHDSIHRSKAVGEPPLLLPFSVFFAIRDAVSAAGGHRVDPPLQAPATSEAILRAVTAVRQALA